MKRKQRLLVVALLIGCGLVVWRSHVWVPLLHRVEYAQTSRLLRVEGKD